jgi:hypothetical protein
MLPALPPRLKSILNWLDQHLLLVMAGFLLAFIPLYPKIPIWSPIEQYIVRVRLEDVFILFTAVVWGIQFLRKKVVWRTTLTWFIVAYAVVGILSVASAVFITHTIPLQPLHVGKSLLHYFRYLEYFSLFFIVFSAVRTRKDAAVLLGIFAFTVIGISVYGFGQKYFYWPVYSTMNREFSKGIRLYLTPHARVQSTFAGHYDMAAFLVIALPIVLALAFRTSHRLGKVLFFGAFWVGTWLLIVSASRTSFLAYLFGLFFAIVLTALSQPKWRGKLGFAFSRGFVILGITTVLFASFGEDLQERLMQVIDSNPQTHDAFHTFNKERKDWWTQVTSTNWLASLTSKVQTQKPPENAISTDQAIAMGVLTPTDERPVTTKPADVYVDVPDIQKVATKSADGTTKIIEVDKGPRVYSENAMKLGLSLAIRLDTLWPHAIQGFMTNPVLGKGYATLNKDSVDQFTEAESTDNNFLRTLGETGLAGFITFYGGVVFLSFLALKHIKDQDKLKAAVSIGLFSATIGLLLNAIYIDVFASSKVAQTFWALSGLFMALLLMRPDYQAQGSNQGTPRLTNSTSDLAVALSHPNPVVESSTTAHMVKYTGVPESSKFAMTPVKASTSVSNTAAKKAKRKKTKKTQKKR